MRDAAVIICTNQIETFDFVGSWVEYGGDGKRIEMGFDYAVVSEDNDKNQTGVPKRINFPELRLYGYEVIKAEERSVVIPEWRIKSEGKGAKLLDIPLMNVIVDSEITHCSFEKDNIMKFTVKIKNKFDFSSGIADFEIKYSDYEVIWHEAKRKDDLCYM